MLLRCRIPHLHTSLMDPSKAVESEMNSESLAFVTIGMLAHDASETIKKTLESLLEQSLVQESDLQVEIVIVPNGCTDATEQIAKVVLEAAGGWLPSNVSWRVCSLNEPGKCNAWNELVHRIADERSEFIIFMDSDIVFLEEETLANLVKALRQDQAAVVSVDTPVKDIATKKKRRWIEWFSLRVSDVAATTERPAICGQLYCARASVVKEIWLPQGLPVEDGFLRAFVQTHGFTCPDRYERIIRAPNASHEFEAHVHTGHLIAHEEWLVAASTINTFIYTYLWDRCSKGGAAGQIIRDRNFEDPFWLDSLVTENIKNKGFWIVPLEFVIRRFLQLKNKPLMGRITRFPIALVAFLFDCLICARVNRILKRDGCVKYWRSSAERHRLLCAPTASEQARVRQAQPS